MNVGLAKGRKEEEDKLQVMIAARFEVGGRRGVAPDKGKGVIQ